MKYDALNRELNEILSLGLALGAAIVALSFCLFYSNMPGWVGLLAATAIFFMAIYLDKRHKSWQKRIRGRFNI